VNKVLKGQALNELVISEYGGFRADGNLEVYHDLPLLEYNKSYLLFLEKIEDDTDRNGKYQYVEGIQGYYEFEEVNKLLGTRKEKKLKSHVEGEINQAVINLSIEDLEKIIQETQ